MLSRTTSLVTLAIVLLLSAFYGCSIEKRQYRNGYHITWNKSFSATSVEQNNVPVVVMENKPVKSVVYTTPKVPSSAPIQFLDEITVDESSFTTEIQRTSGPIVIWTDTSKTIKPKKRTSLSAEERKKENNLILTISLIALGLIPFGVLVYFGGGREFGVNLLLWLVALGAVTVFILLAINEMVGAAFLAILIAFGFTLWCLLHAVLKILKAEDKKPKSAP